MDESEHGLSPVEEKYLQKMIESHKHIEGTVSLPRDATELRRMIAKFRHDELMPVFQAIVVAKKKMPGSLLDFFPDVPIVAVSTRNQLISGLVGYDIVDNVYTLSWFMSLGPMQGSQRMPNYGTSDSDLNYIVDVLIQNYGVLNRT